MISKSDFSGKTKNMNTMNNVRKIYSNRDLVLIGPLHVGRFGATVSRGPLLYRYVALHVRCV